ncbi:MAG TPA: LLM class F420-dependent oxidoreductase [Candidatus Tectomicrobia bacterium]|nr:LLM class F420-dependent oxidoreductase [Candidatus Tectomicrobia bacterium]
MTADAARTAGAETGTGEAARRWAITVPLDGFTLAEHADLAREAERLGYTGAWSFEVDGVDGFTPLAVVAGATGLRVGIAIANVFTRGPATLAISAAGLAELAPGRFCLGVGAGSQPIVEAWNGGVFREPATRVREYVQVLRAALGGERVVFSGKTVRVDGFRLSRPPARPVPIHVAALRPGMLRVAGEVGDGVVLNWLAADDVPRAVAIVREAAARAGRDPDAVEITARLLVHVDPPGPGADLGARRHVTAYLNVPVYRAFHEWLGRGAELGAMWRAWERGDRKAALETVPDAVVRALILRGTAGEIRAHVHRYLDAGIRTAFLSLSTSETDPERRRARLRDALRALAPSGA